MQELHLQNVLLQRKMRKLERSGHARGKKLTELAAVGVVGEGGAELARQAASRKKGKLKGIHHGLVGVHHGLADAYEGPIKHSTSIHNHALEKTIHSVEDIYEREQVRLHGVLGWGWEHISLVFFLLSR